MKSAAKFVTSMGAPLLALALALPGQTAHAQQYGPPPQGPPPGQGYDHPRGDWDAPPGEYSDVARRGFHDGIQAARYDFSQHRPPAYQRNPSFRHPPAPPQLRNDYRNGFQSGYQRAFDHMMRDDHDHHDGGPPGNGYYPH